MFTERQRIVGFQRLETRLMRAKKMVKRSVEMNQATFVCGFVTTSDPFIYMLSFDQLLMENRDYSSFKNLGVDAVQHNITATPSNKCNTF